MIGERDERMEGRDELYSEYYGFFPGFMRRFCGCR